MLHATDVSEVWGVGRRIAAQLKEGGVHTVHDLRRLDRATVRRRWSVTMERTVRELQGQPCIELDDAPAAKQEIACTRSFGKPVTDLAPLIEAVSEFTGRAAEKLRSQGSLASQLLVLHTRHLTGRDRGSLEALWCRCADRRQTLRCLLTQPRWVCRRSLSLGTS